MNAEPIYNTYAPIYDAAGFGRFGAHLAGVALRWLGGRGAAVGRVLDLACGTGEAALIFAAAGCRVVGLDRSAAMLAIAQGKARDAGADVALLAGDLRCPGEAGLEPESFDLATCFADSLNYLTEPGDLERSFAEAARLLRPGGYLIFDMNTDAEYDTWDELDRVTYDEPDCLIYNRLDFDRASALAKGEIVWFVRELDRWWRGAETHTQRAWSEAEIDAALRAARLELLARMDANGAPIDAASRPTRVVYAAGRAEARP